MITLTVDVTLLKKALTDIEFILKGVEYKAVKLHYEDGVLTLTTGSSVHYKRCIECYTESHQEATTVYFLYSREIATYLSKSSETATIKMDINSLQITTDLLSIRYKCGEEIVDDVAIKTEGMREFETVSFVLALNTLSNLKKHEKAYGKQFNVNVYENAIQLISPTLYVEIECNAFRAVIPSNCVKATTKYLQQSRKVKIVTEKNYTAFLENDGTLVIPTERNNKEFKSLKKYAENSKFILSTNIGLFSSKITDLSRSTGNTACILSLYEDGLKVSINTPAVFCNHQFGTCKSKGTISFEYNLELFEDILNIFKNTETIGIYKKGDNLCLMGGQTIVLLSCQTL